MRLSNVEHRYRFEFDPGEVALRMPDGRPFSVDSAVVAVTPADGGVEFYTTRFRGFTHGIARTRRELSPPDLVDEHDVERQLVARVREIRGTS